jgi:hypothetical protein
MPINCPFEKTLGIEGAVMQSSASDILRFIGCDGGNRGLGLPLLDFAYLPISLCFSTATIIKAFFPLDGVISVRRNNDIKNFRQVAEYLFCGALKINIDV